MSSARKRDGCIFFVVHVCVIFPHFFVLFVQENVLSSMRFHRQESAEEEAKIGDTCSRIEFRAFQRTHKR